VGQSADEKLRAAYELWEKVLADRARRFVSRFTGLDATDREDLLAEAREAMVDALRQRQVKDPEAYGWTTIRNFIRKHALQVRKQREEVLPIDTAQLASGSEPVIPGPEEIIGEAIRGLVKELPVRARVLLSACFADGLTVAELARRIGIPRTTAASEIAAAVVKLRRSLLDLSRRDARLGRAIGECWGRGAIPRLSSRHLRWPRKGPTDSSPRG
jgi:RNA polymerase sigma factor (sigma-70 family)